MADDPSDGGDHDGWFASTFGVDPGEVAAKAAQAASDAAQSVASGVAQAAQAVSDTTSTAVQDVSAAVDDGAANAAAGPAASPAEAPGLLEEAEEAAVSGVRAVAKALPEATTLEEAGVVVSAVAVSPAVAGAVVGVALGAAILLYSKDGEALWDGQDNPETGKQFTSQEEWDKYQASKRNRQKGNAPVVQPDVDPWDDPDKPPAPKPDDDKPKTCEELGIDRCGPNTWESEKDFRNDPRNRALANQIARYSRQPGDNGMGEHVTYYDKRGDEIGSVRVIQCCLPGPAGARAVLRYVFNP